MNKAGLWTLVQLSVDTHTVRTERSGSAVLPSLDSAQDERGVRILELSCTSLIINRCKIQRQNWKRDFEPWHEYYWKYCDQQLDRMALVPVANSVQRLKYGKEQTGQN